MKVVLAFRGEFGMKLYWFVPAVHAIEDPKVVYMEEGEEALYPSAKRCIPVPRRNDPERRNRYDTDATFLEWVKADALRRGIDAPEFLTPNAKWPRKRFIPEPKSVQQIRCEVVVCPRRRLYGAEKNWPEWFDLTERLVQEGIEVFAAGAEDSSYSVPCPKSWDYPRTLDAAIEAVHAAKLVVATDAGLAHLAVLCGRPLLMVTHKGLVAPGPSIDETGKHMDDRFWKVRMERYEEANHTGSPIEQIDGWYRPDEVFKAIMGLV